MDTRIRERRFRVARERGRRRMLVLVSASVIALLAAGAYWVSASDSFTVRRVIVPEMVHVTTEQVRSAVSTATGTNLLRVSIDELEQRVGTIPYVRSVRVHRRFPDALEVRIEEYAPRALVRARDGRRWVVAEDGRVLQAAGDSAMDLPLLVAEGDVWPQTGGVVDPEVVAALPLLGLLADPTHWPPNHPVGSIRVAVDGDVTVVLAGGAEVRLGEPVKLEQKLTVALAIIDQYLREGRSLAYVDVREPSRSVARAR